MVNSGIKLDKSCESDIQALETKGLEYVILAIDDVFNSVTNKYESRVVIKEKSVKGECVGIKRRQYSRCSTSLVPIRTTHQNVQNRQWMLLCAISDKWRQNRNEVGVYSMVLWRREYNRKNDVFDDESRCDEENQRRVVDAVFRWRRFNL